MESDPLLESILTPAQRAYCEKIYQQTILPNYSSLLRDLTPLPEVLIQLISQYAAPETILQEKIICHSKTKYPPKIQWKIKHRTEYTLLFGVRHGPYRIHTSRRESRMREGKWLPFSPWNAPKLCTWGCYEHGKEVGLFQDDGEYQVLLPASLNSEYGYLSPEYGTPGVWYFASYRGLASEAKNLDPLFFEIFFPERSEKQFSIP